MYLQVLYAYMYAVWDFLISGRFKQVRGGRFLLSFVSDFWTQGIHPDALVFASDSQGRWRNGYVAPPVVFLWSARGTP